MSSVLTVMHVGLVVCQKFQKINLAYKRLITDNENVSLSKVSRFRFIFCDYYYYKHELVARHYILWFVKSE